ncbi:hypothetical protein C9374_011706 [Naegleria lovaniensis]|uniref:Cytidyltransferase-like domain-containing protein n=1 Tax=Naegleria lovaniensis TaxID=51637 RepID=A0AA88KF69_NAELO|nr:uncharacterized protein C9374_011706 [Naegleria lovaniensis]KAG2373821.1 hypothetical protein C9374_011706 [Naegleria lovaniensis]
MISLSHPSTNTSSSTGQSSIVQENPPPQFHILWFDTNFSHLSESISKFHNVLFNTLVHKCHLEKLINHPTHLQSSSHCVQYLKDICKQIGILNLVAEEEYQNQLLEISNSDRFIKIENDEEHKTSRSLLNHQDHHLLIITSLGGNDKKGLTILESVKILKQSYPNSKIFSAVYSQTAMHDTILQNICSQVYQADFVCNYELKWNFPMIEQPSSIMSLECFVANLYQESYYPKLVHYIHSHVLKLDKSMNLGAKFANFSPSSPLIKPFMKLVAEEEREQKKKEQQQDYDTTYEWIPLRKIAHNLHLRHSTQASKFSQKSSTMLHHHPAYVVLIATGGLNPPHNMHLHMLRQAQDFAENFYELRMKELCSTNKKLKKELFEKHVRPLEIVGGFMSPSHDAYIHSKMVKYDHAKDGQKAYNAHERLLLCELASQDDPFISSYPWESMQSTFVSFSQVANTLSQFLRSSECPLSILMPQHPQTRTLQDSKSYLRVAFVMGADLILRASARRFDYVNDMMTFVIGRSGSDSQQVLASLQNIHSNLPVFYVDPDLNFKNSTNSTTMTDLSSTQVRKLLKIMRLDSKAHDLQQMNEWSKESREAYETLRQVLDEKVLNYIVTHLNQ